MNKVFKYVVIFIIGGLLVAAVIGYLRKPIIDENNKIRRERDSLVEIMPFLMARDSSRIRFITDSMEKINRQNLEAVKTNTIVYVKDKTASDSLEKTLQSVDNLKDSASLLVKIVSSKNKALSSADSVIKSQAQAIAHLQFTVDSSKVLLTEQQSQIAKLNSSLKNTQKLDCFILGIKALGSCPSRTTVFIAGAVVGASAYAIAR